MTQLSEKGAINIADDTTMEQVTYISAHHPPPEPKCFSKKTCFYAWINFLMIVAVIFSVLGYLKPVEVKETLKQVKILEEPILVPEAIQQRGEKLKQVKILEEPTLVTEEIQQGENAPLIIAQATQGSHKLEGGHDHPKLKMNYPTVGVPKPGLTYNFTRVEDKDLIHFDQETNELFKPYNDTNCQYTRIGRAQDGGYVLCGNFLRNAQYIVNFGIRDDDSFGCDLSSLLQIPNYQYDCTTNVPQTCPTNNGANQFQMICGGERTEETAQYTFFTLEDIIKSKKLVGKHIFLKMDIEGGQYQALRYLPIQMLDNIDQIVMELHFDSIYREQWGILDIFRSLTDKFVTVNYHMNNYGCHVRYPQKKTPRLIPSSALEVTLVNRKLISVNSLSRTFKQPSLNSANDNKHPDCQINH